MTEIHANGFKCWGKSVSTWSMAVAAKDIKGMVEGCSLLFVCIDTMMKSPHCCMSSR